MKSKKLNLVTTKTETVLDTAAIIGSVVPWLGGPISNVLNGITLERKLKRVHEVIMSVSSNLADFESRASQDYVQSEEFEELLEKTLRNVSEEKSERKRAIYKAFLTNAVRSPRIDEYDIQVSIINCINNISIDHLQILKAIQLEPAEIINDGADTSPVRTLIARLPDFEEEKIDELLSQLYDMQITLLPSFRKLYTSTSAIDLRSFLSEFGRRVIDYIIE